VTPCGGVFGCKAAAPPPWLPFTVSGFSIQPPSMWALPSLDGLDSVVQTSEGFKVQLLSNLYSSIAKERAIFGSCPSLGICLSYVYYP